MKLFEERTSWQLLQDLEATAKTTRQIRLISNSYVVKTVKKMNNGGRPSQLIYKGLMKAQTVL